MILLGLTMKSWSGKQCILYLMLQLPFVAAELRLHKYAKQHIPYRLCWWVGDLCKSLMDSSQLCHCKQYQKRLQEAGPCKSLGIHKAENNFYKHDQCCKQVAETDIENYYNSLRGDKPCLMLTKVALSKKSGLGTKNVLEVGEEKGRRVMFQHRHDLSDMD